MRLIENIGEKQLADIKLLIHHTVRVCYPAIYPKEVVEFFIRYHSSEQIRSRASSGILIALEEDNAILGTGFLDGEEMGGVYIHPEYQRKGYGTMIVNFLLDKAVKKGIDKIWLDATPFAKPLYLKSGFTVSSPMVQMVGDVALHYFKMEKIL